jgi:hypothetical protein
MKQVDSATHEKPLNSEISPMEMTIEETCVWELTREEEKIKRIQL